MDTIQNNSCGCGTVTEKPGSSDNGCCSSGNEGEYACNTLSDPEWIQKNFEYFPSGFAVEKGIFKDISPEQADQMIQDNSQDQNLAVLDVKTEQEYQNNHVSGSTQMDFFSSTFKDDLFGLDKDKVYIIICKVGIRSEIAMKLMKKMGFKEVYNVLGGDDRWIAQEIPHMQFNQPCTAAQ
ncbi:MAG: rhodanese-like domain-containing protein [Desulfobacteraceae bacterium]|nr:rhodanese-like domain-containing protein [Desulfobacteraceae bacterium]